MAQDCEGETWRPQLAFNHASECSEQQNEAETHVKEQGVVSQQAHTLWVAVRETGSADAIHAHSP